MVSDPKNTCLGLEYFCAPRDGLWAMPDEDLVALAGRELVLLELCGPGEIIGERVVRQAKAYPVYDETYKENVGIIRKYAADRLTNLQLVGRNGMHRYNNQDHSMTTALLAAGSILGEQDSDPWKVNTSAEYHEEVRANKALLTDRFVPTRVKQGTKLERAIMRRQYKSSASQLNEKFC
jgi:hypothetical protein